MDRTQLPQLTGDATGAVVDAVRSAQRDVGFHANLFWCAASAVIVMLCLWAAPAVAQSRAPVAVTAPDISAMVGVSVIIDGSKSNDPGGALITFHWTIAEAPPGSTATLDAADPAPMFVPDLPGTYLFQLVVSNDDGTASPPATMALIAFASSPFPNARTGKNRWVSVGARVDLDAGTSFDPLDRSLTFRWTLVAAPEASRIGDVDIMLRDSSRPWFTPDAAGAYVLRLEASNGERTSEDRIVVTAAAGNLAPVADPGWFQYIERRVPIALDGTASVDPDAGPSPLAFAWSLVARPPDSALTGNAIRNANTAVAGVTPDRDGAYVFRLTVTDGVASDADNVLVRQSTARARDASEAAVRGSAAVNAMPGASPVANPDGRKQLANFGLQVHPIVLNVAAGDRGSVTISLLAPSSSTGAARLDVTGLPRGVIATFGTSMLAFGDSTLLTLRADANASVGRHFLRITATEISSSVAATSSAPLQLDVTAENLEAARGAYCRNADFSGVKTAIYVAPNGSDSASCGRTTALPCASIHQGIDNCTQLGCGVLVRYGLYKTTATISLKDGVSIFGSCHFNGAPDDNSAAAGYRTVIEASPAPGSPALNGDGINRPTHVSGLVIVGKDETAVGVAGIASIVMVASHSRGITMTNSTLVAGKGGPGANGRSFPGGPGGPGLAPKPTNFDGGAGGSACAAAPTGGTGNGGSGGSVNVPTISDCNYTCNCASNPGSVGTAGQESGAVMGGPGGGFGGAGCGCARVDDAPTGSNGKPGDAGSCSNQGGQPGSLFGRFQGAKWIASVGGTGAPGAVGSGGGGGGGGGPAVNSDNNYLRYPGQAGGGGGGGGCGGPGGTGGGQGGASIALVLVDSTIAGVPAANSLVPGPGGKGGVGGVGGVGGAGGNGGPGEPSPTGPYFYWYISPNVCEFHGNGAGGPGGAGGRGGPGGGGAGGNGGPSLGIVLVSGSPNPGSASGIYSGFPGPGGAKGVGGFGEYRPTPCNGTDGANGLAGGNAAVWDAK